ncbi:MAG: tryptophan--tRNA ligase [Propionibacteriales bacterium]|nr:tryptophan--tRNA ligase [Propionibacteriales bacterium]
MHSMSSSTRPRSLSGIQPTADSFHFGNYFGALRQWVGLQEDHDAFYFIADLHSLNERPDPSLLRQRTYASVAQLLAAGVDVERSTLFCQSQVVEHTQLAWVFNGLTGFGEAGRMTQFKDKVGRRGEENANVALFTYPILQAADILLYNPHHVPVGEDQRQHLELSRNLAQRFNHHYGETFRLPEPYIVKGTARILDLQDPTSKMSKSASSPNGIIDLLDDPARARKKIRSAVTDSGSEIVFDPETKPGISNLLTIFSAITGEDVETIVARFEGRQYGHLKVELGDVVADFVAGFGERTRAYLDDLAELDRVLAAGAVRAREVAAPVVVDVYDKVGLVRGV